MKEIILAERGVELWYFCSKDFSWCYRNPGAGMVLPGLPIFNKRVGPFHPCIDWLWGFPQGEDMTLGRGLSLGEGNSWWGTCAESCQRTTFPETGEMGSEAGIWEIHHNTYHNVPTISAVFRPRLQRALVLPAPESFWGSIVGNSCLISSPQSTTTPLPT